MSCQDYFGDINRNPNNPPNVTLQVLLPTVQARINYVYGGDISRYTSVVMQHVEGVARQWASANNYQISTSDLNAAWRFNLYAGAYLDLDIITNDAMAGGHNHYVAIAHTLNAFAWMMATDIWGDMPLTEAFQGTSKLQPAFDTQEAIYNQILAWSDEALSLFAGEANGFVPGSDDLIYGGDIDKWTKFVHAIKARAYLHLSNRDASNFNNVLSELSQSFTSVADEAVFNYADGETGAAPWYQFNRDRQGDIEFNPSMVALQDVYDDPRTDLFNEVFNPGAHPVMTRNQSVPFVQFAELKFMEAEALLMTNGDGQDIHDAYIAAISSGLDAYTLDPTTYLANTMVDPGVGNVTLEHIITQKYLALWTSPEIYNDWRRTDIPSLTPNSGIRIPVRMPYAQTEILLNPNTPDIDQLFEPVWWDQ